MTIIESQRQAIADFFRIIEELKRVGVVRTDRYLGDIGEFLCKEYLGLKLAKSTRQKGYDIKTQKKNIKVLPPEGTIANDLRMRDYIKHLIDRYNNFAGSDPTRKVKFSHGVICKNIQDQFGMKWDFVPVARFEELTKYLQDRISKTRQAKINRGKGDKGYSSFDEYCAKHMKINV